MCMLTLLCNSNYLFYSFFFFFNDTATTEIYTLSLHDALPISMLLVACLREPLLHRCTVAIAIGCEGIADAVPTPDEFVEACIDKMQRGALAVTGQPVIQQGLERHTGEIGRAHV